MKFLSQYSHFKCISKFHQLQNNNLKTNFTYIIKNKFYTDSVLNQRENVPSIYRILLPTLSNTCKEERKVVPLQVYIFAYFLIWLLIQADILK